MSVQVAEHVPHHLKRILGRAAYPLTALALLPHRHRPFTARLASTTRHTSSTPTSSTSPTAATAHAGRAIARDTGLDDRQLVIYRLGDANRLRLTLAAVRQTVTGPRRSLAETPFLTTREACVDTDPPMAHDVDGEIRGRTPVQITLDANALRAMVDTDFPDLSASQAAGHSRDRRPLESRPGTAQDVPGALSAG